MPDIIITSELMDGDTGRRFIMAVITAVMLFPDNLKRRMGMKNALVTQLNLDFYRWHKEASLSGEVLIGMLEMAATADMSFLNSEAADKNLSIGVALGLAFERMLWQARKKGESVPFWREESIAMAADLRGVVGEKTQERDTQLFRGVLHMWAAAMRIVWERKEKGLKFERIPCEAGELEKFIQYSAAYMKAGKNYRQSHSKHMFFNEKKCFRFVLQGFELPEMAFEN